MKQLTKEQRYKIEAYLKTGKSKEFIAKDLGVHKSTIYRDIQRNSTKTGIYAANMADLYANERKDRYTYNRKFTNTIEKEIICLIKKKWSPEQISGYYKKNNLEMVSHERIYQYIREDKFRGGMLFKHLRHKLKKRKRPVGKFIPIKDRVSIENRPEIVDKKQRMGDWEIDTIIGKNKKGAIVTIVERKTAFLMMRKLELGKNAKGVAKQVIDMLLPYKKFIHTITADNGIEFAEHKMISKKLDTEFYFANPYSSWERGLSEYTNKLIRQYIPKKSDFNSTESDEILEYQKELNARPRKKLDYNSPFNIFSNFVINNVAFGS